MQHFYYSKIFIISLVGCRLVDEPARQQRLWCSGLFFAPLVESVNLQEIPVNGVALQHSKNPRPPRPTLIPKSVSTHLRVHLQITLMGQPCAFTRISSSWKRHLQHCEHLNCCTYFSPRTSWQLGCLLLSSLGVGVLLWRRCRRRRRRWSETGTSQGKNL